MKRWRGWLALLGWCPALLAAQSAPWPTDPSLSGNAFLSPGLMALQADPANSPITLWVDKGQALWSERAGPAGASCMGCHGDLQGLRQAVASFPRLGTDGRSLVNLEDQIIACRARTGRTGARLEDDDVLALSTALHHAARGTPIQIQPPADAQLAASWQAHLGQGARLFATRLGRINLACVHCHEQMVGRQMRADVVSPGHPTGFPIYRMSWQKPGTLDRRLRACYSGVQATIPPAGAPELRALELYLKVRAAGKPLDGPSIRR